MKEDTAYRAVYHTKDKGQVSGGITNDLEKLHETAEGIVFHWPLVKMAEIIAYPSGGVVFGYYKTPGRNEP